MKTYHFVLFSILTIILSSCTGSETKLNRSTTYSNCELEITGTRPALGSQFSDEMPVHEISEEILYLIGIYNHLDVPTPIVYSAKIDSNKDCFVVNMKVTHKDSVIHKRKLVSSKLEGFKDGNGNVSIEKKLIFTMGKPNNKFREYTFSDFTTNSYMTIRDSFEIGPVNNCTSGYSLPQENCLTPESDSIILFRQHYNSRNLDSDRFEMEYQTIVYAKLI